MRLATASNTINPALLALKAKGYLVQELNSAKNGGPELLMASRDGNEFVAEDPLYLLGLISLWESRGNDWQTRDDESWLLEELGWVDA